MKSDEDKLRQELEEVRRNDSIGKVAWRAVHEERNRYKEGLEKIANTHKGECDSDPQRLRDFMLWAKATAKQALTPKKDPQLPSEGVCLLCCGVGEIDVKHVGGVCFMRIPCPKCKTKEPYTFESAEYWQGIAVDRQEQLRDARSEIEHMKLKALTHKKDPNLPGKGVCIRPAVIAFAREMERILREHDGKGGWVGMSWLEIYERIKDECVELEYALEDYGNNRGPGNLRSPLIQREAVDVANFCMMLSDLYGQPHKKDPQLPSDKESEAENGDPTAKN